MATVFRLPLKGAAAPHPFCRNSRPYLAAATRSGLSLVWKIVLIVELLGPL